MNARRPPNIARLSPEAMNIRKIDEHLQNGFYPKIFRRLTFASVRQTSALIEESKVERLSVK